MSLVSLDLYKIAIMIECSYAPFSGEMCIWRIGNKYLHVLMCTSLELAIVGCTTRALMGTL